MSGESDADEIKKMVDKVVETGRSVETVGDSFI